MFQRIAAIDVVRGYCLVNIYINHIMVGVLHKFSPSNFGLSDSADLFVFLAGVSTYLAYGALNFRESARALWRRAAKLYGCNILLIICTLAASAALAASLDPDALLIAPELRALASKPWPAAAWHVATLQQSVGFSMVLRLYVGLMLMAPLFLWLAGRRWWWALPPAVLIWVATGHHRLLEHESLTGAPIALSPLPWILTFVAGVALSAAMAQKVRLPRSRLLTGAALAVVVGYFALLHAQPYWPEAKAWVAARDTSFWLGGSKSLVSPLRVLHLLALAYLFVAFRDAPVIRLVHRAGPRSFLAVLGRRSLPVFVTGAVLAVTANELLNLANLRWGQGSFSAVLIETLLVAGGIAAMWVAAEGGHEGSPAGIPVDPRPRPTRSISSAHASEEGHRAAR